MVVQQEQSANAGRFFVENEFQAKAELVYHFDEGLDMVIDHTEVADELRNHHLGRALVFAAVEYAREKKIRIRVHCTFAKKMFEREPSWSDVLETQTKNW